MRGGKVYEIKQSGVLLASCLSTYKLARNTSLVTNKK